MYYFTGNGFVTYLYCDILIFDIWYVYIDCVIDARHINPSLVLVQPRKTRPFITERLLMGRKELNQTKQPLTKQCI